DICGAANRERRCPLPTHTQPNKLRRTAVLPLLERDREQFIQRRLLERRLRTIIPGPISRGNGRFRVHHCLPNCLKASARLKAQERSRPHHPQEMTASGRCPLNDNWVSIAFTVWTSARRGASIWARYHMEERS